MACTVSRNAQEELHKAGLLSESTQSDKDIVLVGFCGVQVRPKCIYELKFSLYGQKVSVSTLVVPGQHDQVIVGTNAIKYLILCFKQDPSYWCVMYKSESSGEPNIEQFLRVALRHNKVER